jgi:hypothetical protein
MAGARILASEFALSRGLLDELLAAEWQPADKNISKTIAKLFILH